MYKLTANPSCVLRTTDKAWVPIYGDGADTRDYLHWLADGNTVLPEDEQPPPTPIEQIRAIEAPNDDNRKKITRQFMRAFMFKEAKELAPGMTDAQIQAYLMAQGKGYAKLYLEEQQIIPLRALIP